MAAESEVEESDLHRLYQKMGEVLGAIRNLHEKAELRQAQSEQLHEMVRSDLRVLRQDQRELEEKMDCMAFVMQHDVGALRCGALENTRSIDELATAVNGLRQPISEIVLLKSRIAGLIVGVGIIGSAVLWIAEPIYRWFVDARLLKHWGG